MQNRYVADAGDFGKYLLLKLLCKNDFRLGVNWCLVENENHNNDGKHISYLAKENSISSDADIILFNKLKQIISSESRNTLSIEKSGILPPETRFFAEKIPLKSDRIKWHIRSLSVLSDCDIVFYDPDNGLEVKSYSINSIKAPKYVFFEEIKNTWELGKSIVIYQHTNRNGTMESQIRLRKEQLVKNLSILPEQISSVKSNQGTSRFYLILGQKSHQAILDQNLMSVKNMPNSNVLKWAD